MTDKFRCLACGNAQTRRGRCQVCGNRTKMIKDDFKMPSAYELEKADEEIAESERKFMKSLLLNFPLLIFFFISTIFAKTKR